MKTEKTLLATALLLMANHAAAHHNWSAIYDVESDIEIEGVISSIQWRNPHVRVSFTVNEGTAEEMVYTTESNSVSSLTRMNVTEDVLAVGTRVRVAGYRSRSRDDDIFMNHLLLPDNREVIFLRTAEPRWPDATRIGNTDRLHGRLVEPDFDKRPTSIFAVWNTVYGAQGSHQALRFPGGAVRDRLRDGAGYRRLRLQGCVGTDGGALSHPAHRQSRHGHHPRRRIRHHTRSSHGHRSRRPGHPHEQPRLFDRPHGRRQAPRDHHIRREQLANPALRNISAQRRPQPAALHFNLGRPDFEQRTDGSQQVVGVSARRLRAAFRLQSVART